MTSIIFISKMKKLLTAMFALLLLVAVPTALAASMSVSVDNVPALGGTPLSVVAGDTLPVQVEYMVDTNASDVVVEVELSYGHGKSVQVATDSVAALSGVYYKKNVQVRLPSTLETSADGEQYSLEVRLKDGKGHTLATQDYDLLVQRKTDVLEIQKVMMPSVLTAGSPAKMTVVVKNVGSDNQDDVYVKVTSSELGISVEERAGDIKSSDNGDSEDVATIDLPLRVSNNAVEGSYTFTVEAYNDNADVTSTKTVTVNGVRKAADSTEVVPVVNSLNLNQGKSGLYELRLLNLGNAAQTYSVAVSGLDGWATYQVNPLSVQLDPEASQLVDLSLSVSDKALVGEHTFTVKVNSDGKEVRSLTLTANVTKGGLQVDAMLISVVVLAIVLVVLVVVLVKSRKTSDESEVEESYY